jgi:hypothetical protein
MALQCIGINQGDVVDPRVVGREDHLAHLLGVGSNRIQEPLSWITSLSWPSADTDSDGYCARKAVGASSRGGETEGTNGNSQIAFGRFHRSEGNRVVNCSRGLVAEAPANPTQELSSCVANGFGLDDT